MKVLVLSLLVFLASFAHAEDSDVIELDASNFDEGVDKELILVEFYAPWCGHCKRLAPEYEKAATALVKDGIPLAKVDCPANSALCSKYGVSGYPTLKIFRDGEVSSDYAGPRTSEGIISTMRKQSGPSSKDLETAEAMKEFLNHEEHSVIGFFADSDSKLKDAFLSASNSLREDFRFGHTTSKDLLDEYEYNDKVVVFQPPRLHTKLEESRVVYDGPARSTKIKEFVQENFMGMAGVRTPDNVKYFDSKKPLCVVYFEVDYHMNPKGTNYWRNRVIKVAKAFVDEGMTFAIASAQLFNHELTALGMEGSALPAAGIYDAKGKYAMETDFSVDNLKEFVQQYYDGALEVHVKSEPIPEDNDGPVKVVVGKNFDEIVMDESKDVLIEFYAPWCGHCKALAPKYEELGEKLKDDPNIVIAKSDATVNDYPSAFEVQGFPTIYWVPAGNKSRPQKYQGGREVSDFVDYLKKEATHPPVIQGEKEKKKKKKDKKSEL